MRVIRWVACLLVAGAAPPTAVLFRTHLLDATVLAILRRCSRTCAGSTTLP